MIIDVWSDVVCPWCYIGKRRLEKALTQFGHKDEIVIRHRAFQLQPDAGETMPTSKLLEGLCYNLDDTLSGNTFDAHRLLLWAATIGKEQELLEAMYSSYFEKSLPLFAHQDLVAVAQSVGIAPVDAMNILESDQFITAVNEDRELASRLGATGVPFFVIDMKYGISGAQPLEAFVETLNTAWKER